MSVAPAARSARWTRRLVKTAMAGVVYRGHSGIARVSSRRQMPLVIGYHRVVDNFDHEASAGIPPMLVSRTMLERNLDWIGQRYRFVTLDELGAHLSSGAPMTKPLAAVTFDDGYQDVHRHAFPLLVKKGIPAGVFVVTNQVGTSRLLWHDRAFVLLTRAFDTWRKPTDALARQLLAAGVPRAQCRGICRMAPDARATMSAVQRAVSHTTAAAFVDGLEAEVGPIADVPDGLRPLSWEMVRDMHRAGITIGSHTRNHVLLSREATETVVDEAAGSRRDLEAQLGAPVSHFAYPDGHFNRRSVDALASSGYRYGYTTCTHRDAVHPLLTIPRRLLWERSSVDPAGAFSPAILYCQAHGFLTGTPACTRQDHV